MWEDGLLGYCGWGSIILVGLMGWKVLIIMLGGVVGVVYLDVMIFFGRGGGFEVCLGEFLMEGEIFGVMGLLVVNNWNGDV